MPVNVTDTLHVTTTEGVLAPTNEIYDKGLGKFQNQINASIPTVVLLSVWYDDYRRYLTFTETAQEIFDKISALKESDNDRIFVIREERIPGEVTYTVANVFKAQNHYFDIFWLSGNYYGSATINSDDGDKYVEITERKGIPLSIDLLRNYNAQYAYDESLGKYSFVGELSELKEQFYDISIGSSGVIFVWNADTGYLYLASAKSTGSYADQRVFNIAWVENEYPSDAGSSDTPTVSPKFCYVEFDMQATEKPEIHKIDYLPAGGSGGSLSEGAEQAVAESSNNLEQRIAALEKFIYAVVTGEAVIPKLQVKSLNVYDENSIVKRGTGAPTVPPDFAGQFYVDTEAPAVYFAKANNEVSDWTNL